MTRPKMTPFVKQIAKKQELKPDTKGCCSFTTTVSSITSHLSFSLEVEMETLMFSQAENVKLTGEEVFRCHLEHYKYSKEFPFAKSL